MVASKRQLARLRRTAITLVAGGAGLVIGATVAAWFAPVWWMCELATHFRLQYVVVLAPIVPMLWLSRRQHLAVASVAVALMNLVMILPVYAGRASSSAPTLRAIQLNVLTDNRSHEAVRSLIRTEQPDFVMLEEVSRAWYEALRDIPGYEHTHAVPREDHFGIMLLSRHPIEHVRTVYLSRARVPTLIAEVRVDGQRLTLVGCHPLSPVSGTWARLRNEELGVLGRAMGHMPPPLVLLGDLNVTPWSPVFQGMLDRSGLRDSRQGFGLQASWPSFSSALRIPIDHCLVSPDLLVTARRVGPHVGSDHYPVIVDFAMPVAVAAAEDGAQ